MTTSSDKNVLIMRTLIALCKRDKKLPSSFYELGYRQILIEQPFRVGDDRTVVPDLLISSKEQNNCIIWESKSGRNVDSGQAVRLSLIRDENFRDKPLNVAFGESFSFDIAYACCTEHGEAIRVDLDRLSKDTPSVGSFPIVGVDDSYGLRKHSGSFSIQAMDVLLANGIQVDVRKIPAQYYPFDKDSALSEIAPFVVQSIVSHAARDEAQFSAEQIAKESYGTNWDYVASNRTRDNIGDKVDKILHEATTRELKGYLVKVGKGGLASRKWHLKYANRTGDAYPAGRLKTLQKRCREFVNRLRLEEAGAKQLALPLFLEED